MISCLKYLIQNLVLKINYYSDKFCKILFKFQQQKVNLVKFFFKNLQERLFVTCQETIYKTPNFKHLNWLPIEIRKVF